MAGLDVDRMLDERDPFRRQIHAAVINRWQQLAADLRGDLAIRIANDIRKG